MNHSMQSLEIQSIVAFDLGDVICLGYRPVALPFIGSHFCGSADVVDKDVLQGPCGEILYLHGVHAPYLPVLGKLYRSHSLLLLGIVTSADLALLDPADDELVHVYGAVHGIVPTGLHGFSNLEHEQTGRFLRYPIPHAHVTGRKTLGAGGHLEADEERLAHTELYLMEQRIGRCRLGMPADVAGSGEILAYLSRPMVALDTFKAFFSFDPGKVFLAVKVGLEPIGEL